MVAQPPRSLEQRRDDVLDKLINDGDVWVATVGEDGAPYLVPLSFLWWDGKVVVATPESNPTGRNLARAGTVRLEFGHTRDVVLMDGTVRHYRREVLPSELGDAFAEKAWDARLEKTRFGYYEITPIQIQAWREGNEIAGRVVMRDGKWLG